MSHRQQIDFVNRTKAKFPEKFKGTKVLEIGSLDINGSVRGCFTDSDYTGIDVGAGKGVDIVCEGQKYDAPDSSFDVTISCECFEHNPFWAETFNNMARMTKPGGLIVITCATTGRPEHGTSRTNRMDSPLTVDRGWEYYRNLTEEDFKREIPFLSDLFSEFQFTSQHETHDLYFFGLKK